MFQIPILAYIWLNIPSLQECVYIYVPIWEPADHDFVRYRHRSGPYSFSCPTNLYGVNKWKRVELFSKGQRKLINDFGYQNRTGELISTSLFLASFLSNFRHTGMSTTCIGEEPLPCMSHQTRGPQPVHPPLDRPLSIVDLPAPPQSQLVQSMNHHHHHYQSEKRVRVTARNKAYPEWGYPDRISDSAWSPES